MITNFKLVKQSFVVYLPVVGEDESHSGDGSIDLFTEEELLPFAGPSFRTVTRPWPVSANPMSPTEDITMTRSVLKPQLEESDSSLPVKRKMLNNSEHALEKPFQTTTESFAQLRALQSSATTDNISAIWTTTHTTPQTPPKIEEEREERTTSQTMPNMISTSSHVKMKSNSATSETRDNLIPSTVDALLSQSEVTMKTLTEQTPNTGTISSENFTQADEQTTLSSTTPSPSTQSQTIIIPEAYSTTVTDEGIHMKTDPGMTATTTDSGNTGSNVILTASHVKEGESDSSTTASMTTDRLVSSTTTTITTGKPDKRNTHSISLVKRQQGQKQKFIRPMKDQDLQGNPQRQSGKQSP